MNDERITTESVALTAQETDPIVLRDSGNRRLVFKPMIVDKPEAPVRGVFVWQRKRGDGGVGGHHWRDAAVVEGW